MGRYDRHQQLLARLREVQEKKEKIVNDAYAFLCNPAATEKVAAKTSVHDLNTLSTEINLLCAQTGAVVERIANANDIAEKMTREVRRIDIIQSRMSACATQASQLLNLRNAMSNIRRAMQQENYTEATEYLKELKQIETLMSFDIADKLRMETIENNLKLITENQFEEGLIQKDMNTLLVFGPLFQHLGKEYEERGYQVLLSHLKADLHATLNPLTMGTFSTKELMDHLTSVFNTVAMMAQQYDGLIKSCFFNVDGLSRFIQALYAIGEQSSVDILNKYMAQRKFYDSMKKDSNTLFATASTEPVVNNIESHSLATANTISATENEISTMNEQLNEMALLIQHTQTYERFMRSRVNETEDTKPVLPLSNESELGKAVQELAGFYCYFENELLTKASTKAFHWEELCYSAVGALSPTSQSMQSHNSFHSTDNDAPISVPISSAVDEIFYVSRNSGLRALATGHPDCAAGVLNMINTVLRDTLGDRMRERIRKLATNQGTVLAQSESYGFGENSLLNSIAAAAGSNQLIRDQMTQSLAKLGKSTGIAPLTTSQLSSGMSTSNGPPSPVHPAVASTKSATELQTPSVIMNSLETAIDYIRQMKTHFEEELPQSFPTESRQVTSCMNTLEDAAVELSQVLGACLKVICKIIEPRIKLYLSGPPIAPQSNTSSINLPGIQNKPRLITYELTEQMYTFNEANDPFAYYFVVSMKQLLQPFRTQLSRTNFKRLVDIIATCTSSVLEARFQQQHTRFNQLGALQFDKDLRVLMGYFNETTDCRDIFAKLNQTSVLLNLEFPEDAIDVYGKKQRGAINWKLSPARVKEILSRRVEFSDASINSLVFK